jgi:chorismate synthase
MAGNTFGQIFQLTTFGESHGHAVGGVIDGCPAGLTIDIDYVQHELDRRKPGQSHLTTKRIEADKVEFLSGLLNGVSTGTPIAFMVRNKDQQSKDYDHLKAVYRPSHADFAYDQKYGFHDYKGGGRASARETVSRVVGGAIAKLLLKDSGITIRAYTKQIGLVKSELTYNELNLDLTEDSLVRCPDMSISNEMIELIEETQKEGDTLGGIIECIVSNTKSGWGEPVFDKLQADLAKSMLSINAVKGFEYGMGFKAAEMKGSEHNDAFEKEDEIIKPTSNRSGGIQGGISNGQDIYFRIAFKPVATLMKDQKTVDKAGRDVILKGKGRHDVCVIPRAVPIVEAMAALVIADHFLRNKNSTL